MIGKNRMEIDWTYVKRTSLWHYDELIQKIQSVMEYSFVIQYYNHSIKDAISYSEKLQQGYILNGKKPSQINDIIETFILLYKNDVKDYKELLQNVADKTKCESFLGIVDIEFEKLIQLLNFLFRWILPFKCTIRELVDTIPYADQNYIQTLKEFQIKSNLDVLEICRQKNQRLELSNKSKMSTKFLLDITHRADISRLAYVRAKTIKHLCGGGYDTLMKISSANYQKMKENMTEYYKSLGKNYSDFQSVIPLDWMIGGAKVIPNIIEE